MRRKKGSGKTTERNLNTPVRFVYTCNRSTCIYTLSTSICASGRYIRQRYGEVNTTSPNISQPEVVNDY